MPTFGDRVRAAVRSFQTPPPPQRGTFLRGEISFADPKRLFPGGYTTPYNPSVLVTRQGLRVFDQMRQDDQVKAALAFKQHAVMAAGWTISSPEEYPDDWEPTLCVDWMLKSLEGTLEDDLLEIMTALAYGYSVTEKVWGPVEEGPFAGKIGLKALKTRRPESFDFDVDPYGNIKPDGVLQRKTSYSPDRLPVTKFVIYSHDLEFSNIYGRSDLEAAFRHWWAKDNVLKWLVMLLEALGIPPVFAKYDPARYSPDQIDTLKDIVKDLQARSFGIIPSPGGSLPGQGPALEFWAPELAGQATRVFLPAIEYYDQAIARAILMPGLIGVSPETQVGSFARAKVNFDVFMLVVDKLRRELEERVMREQIIKPLVDLNYVVDDYPVFKFLPLTEDDRALILDKWLAAVGAGVVQRQSDDEIHIREMLEFPEKQEGQVIEEPQGNGEGNYPALGDVDRLLRGGMKQAHQHPRTYIRYDRQTNYARIEMNLARIEDDGARRLRPLFAVVRDRLVQDMERHFPEKPQLVNELEIRGLGDVQEALKEFVRSAYGLGEETIRTELPRTFQRISFAPTEALRWLSAKALTISGVLRDKLTNDAKQVLLNALKFGEPQGETLAKLRAVFEPYVGDPTLIRDNEVVEPYRLETILRTNATEAFNQGRLTTADDPAVRSFLRGMMYSAVIDDRTTPVCRFLDGKVFPMDEVELRRLAPPNHFNALASGTQVLTKQGWRPIERMQPGEEVWTHRRRWRPVYAVMGKHPDGPTLRELHLSTGRVLCITDEHPVLTRRGWKVAGQVEVGDVLFQHSKEMAGSSEVLLPNPEDFPSPFDEPPVSWSVMRLPQATPMRFPVDFQGDLVGGKSEIDNGAALRVLENERHITGRQKSNQRGLGVSRFPSPACGKRNIALLQDARYPHWIPTLHPLRSTRRPFISLFPPAPGPMRRPAWMNGWVPVGDRDLRDPRADRDTVTLAPRREYGFAQSQIPFNRPDRFATLPVATLNQSLYRSSISQIQRANSWHPAAIVSIVDVRYKGNVWNLAVKDDETYLADGLIVHNCRSILVPVTLDMQVDEADIITPSEVGRAEELAGVGFK